MEKMQFIAELKRIYHNSKRSREDSPFNDLRDSILADIIAKSNNGWDESIASETMQIVEHVFKVQPEATRLASQVRSADAEAVLHSFLASRDYSYTHIRESKDQTPDGYIEGFGNKYLCELKSPILMFDHQAAPFGYKFSTTHGKILDAIHNAKAQLEKLDSKKSLPHILIYTSAHPQLNSSNFVNAIRGYISDQDGTITNDLRGTDIFKNTQPIISSIDLYVWFQMGTAGFFLVSYFVNSSSVHANVVDKLVNSLRKQPLHSMDRYEDIWSIIDRHT